MRAEQPTLFGNPSPPVGPTMVARVFQPLEDPWTKTPNLPAPSEISNLQSQPPILLEPPPHAFPAPREGEGPAEP